MSWSKFLKSFEATKSIISNAVDNAFGKHLLYTNIWTSTVLMFIGDLAQQEIEYQRHMLPERYDWQRLCRMTIVGFGYGPLNHYYYTGLYKLWPKRNLLNVGKKILADQFIMSPICIALLFYGVGLLERNTFTACTEELQSKFFEIYTVDWCIWPPTQFINFYYLPVKFQVVYINSITMFYNIFLSYMKHREDAQQRLKDYEKDLK